jgi:hypothetical protein
MMQILSSINTGSVIQELMGREGEHKHTDNIMIPSAYFYFFRVKEIG